MEKKVKDKYGKFMMENLIIVVNGMITVCVGIVKIIASLCLMVVDIVKPQIETFKEKTKDLGK